MLLNANLLFSALLCLFVGRAVRTPSIIDVDNALGGDFRCSPELICWICRASGQLTKAIAWRGAL